MSKKNYSWLEVDFHFRPVQHEQKTTFLWEWRGQKPQRLNLRFQVTESQENRKRWLRQTKSRERLSHPGLKSARAHFIFLSFSSLVFRRSPGARQFSLPCGKGRYYYKRWKEQRGSFSCWKRDFLEFSQASVLLFFVCWGHGKKRKGGNNFLSLLSANWEERTQGQKSISWY